jgi:acyl dehydratase
MLAAAPRSPPLARTVIPEISALKRFVGHEFEPSPWVLVDQARVDAFAQATGDQQWIHCDPERAKRESPFGTTIAHGNLTLSLVPGLLTECVEVRGVRLMVNPGIEHVRLRAPVRVGSQVRLRGSLMAVRELKGGGARATYRCSIEVEDETRPAAFGDFHVVYYP